MFMEVRGDARLIMRIRLDKAKTLISCVRLLLVVCDRF